jgi:hypothetical protein
MEKIDKFAGEYHFLSNFYEHPIEYKGKIWPSVEHAYQAQKAIDPTNQERIRTAKTPAQAKKYGRVLRLKDDWESTKDQIMIDLIRIKFIDPDLARKLLATGDAVLIEGNTWGDTYFGVCDGVGLNKLGNILMVIREERARDRDLGPHWNAPL